MWVSIKEISVSQQNPLELQTWKRIGEKPDPSQGRGGVELGDEAPGSLGGDWFYRTWQGSLWHWPDSAPSALWALLAILWEYLAPLSFCLVQEAFWGQGLCKLPRSPQLWTMSGHRAGTQATYCEIRHLCVPSFQWDNGALSFTVPGGTEALLGWCFTKVWVELWPEGM